MHFFCASRTPRPLALEAMLLDRAASAAEILGIRGVTVSICN